jgi:hypothetical protein
MKKIEKIKVDGVDYEIGGSPLLAITYDELKTLRDNSNLVVGQQYRITDYQCTTVEPNTKSGNHQFDIIVVADSTNTLNENARAVQHEGDTYFAESNLSAWELKYDLDNDTTKYAWADEVNGKGVIYWLKDEFNNECPYDFKNIQFIRESVIDEDNGITFTNVYFYTFSAYDYLESSGIQSDIQDASIITKKESIDDYYNFCVCNIIKPYFNDTGNIEDPLNILNDIIFINRYSLEDQSYFMCYSNTFGNDCFNNTFGNECFSNTFGSLCYNTTFGYGCKYNTFGYGCTHNTFGNYCSYNTFGLNCSNNTFGNECLHNNFGDNCYSTFGNNCSDNTFGNECYEITFVQDYCQYITIENGCKHLEITSDDTEADYGNFIQNIHIHQGVSGDSIKPKVITVARNLDYETTISTVEMQPKLTAGEGINISEDGVISISYENGDEGSY